MLKFSFNSTTLREMDVLQAFGKIRAAGYDGVELMLNAAHLHPLETPPSRIAEIHDFSQSENLPIVSVAAGGDSLLSDKPYQPTMFDRDPSQRARRLDLLFRSMDIAERLGAPVLAFNSGPMSPDVSPDQAWDFIVAGIFQMLAKGGNLILAMEPEPSFPIGTTVNGIELIKQIGNARLMMTTDIGHVNCSEDDCYGAIDRVLPYTRHIHIEDIKGRVHHHEIPGEGDIDFDRVFASLHKAGYEHYISVELHHHNDRWQRALDESLAYLNRYRMAVA